MDEMTLSEIALQIAASTGLSLDEVVQGLAIVISTGCYRCKGQPALLDICETEDGEATGVYVLCAEHADLANSSELREELEADCGQVVRHIRRVKQARFN